MQQKLSNKKTKTVEHHTRKILQQNVQTIIKQLSNAGMLPKDQFQFIIQSSISILKFQPNILKTNSPAYIVGDIHGQFFDLINIFRRYGLPPQTKYIFLGDYVDRGDFSIQVITILFWLKLKYPKSIYLLRGNHQCRVLTSTHNFKNQCKSKYNLKIFQLVVILFQVLPLCCIVDSKYFCVHAGISPNLNSLEQVQKINRFCEIPQKGVLCDLLWSDPTDDNKKQWTFNNVRSCSYFYTKDHAVNFMKKNNLQMIIRGHEVQLQGYKYMQYNKSNKKNVLTIFSAPNYCDKYNNLGSVAIIEKQDIKLDTFKHVEHPYVLPNNMNIFEWSVGIISRQAVKILVQLARSRLLNKPGEKDDLRIKMEQIKKALQEKQKVEESKIYKNNFNKNLVMNIDQNNPLQPEKCLISILLFMSQKKKDQAIQGMPMNLQQIERLKSQSKSLYGQFDKQDQQNEDKPQQVSNSEQLLNNELQQKAKQKIKKKEAQFASKLKVTKLTSNLSTNIVQEQVNEQSKSETILIDINKMYQPRVQINSCKQNPLIFGPKIQQFQKIFPKKKV